MIELNGARAYDVSEVVQILGLTRNTVRNYLNSGKIKGSKLGNKWVIPEDSLKQFFTAFSEKEEAKANGK
jgi:excisionase family DNA binding protein